MFSHSLIRIGASILVAAIAVQTLGEDGSNAVLKAVVNFVMTYLFTHGGIAFLGTTKKTRQLKGKRQKRRARNRRPRNKRRGSNR